MKVENIKNINLANIIEFIVGAFVALLFFSPWLLGGFIAAFVMSIFNSGMAIIFSALILLAIISGGVLWLRKKWINLGFFILILFLVLFYLIAFFFPINQ